MTRSPITSAPLAHSIAVVSGKGGVGKTNLVANLGIASASLGARVLIVDGDLSLANLDVLLGLAPARHVAEVLLGSCALHDALVEGPQGTQILPASTACSQLAALGDDALDALLAPLAREALDYDRLLVDAGAGIGPTVLALARACARVWVVTTPEPTSLADAYATLKLLSRSRPWRPLELLVNAARDERDARQCHGHLRDLAQRFLGIDLPYLGFLPRDPRLVEAVAQQRAAVELFPTAAYSRSIVELASRVRPAARSAFQGETTARI